MKNYKSFKILKTMNFKNYFSLILVVFMFASVIAVAAGKPQPLKPVTMPDDVKAIIDKSCFGCHNTDSKNDKAKEKLDLKTIDTLDKSKMIHALKEISEVVEENEMPPAKFLEKFPEKKLTDAEKKTLMDWANNEAKSLMK
jgi:uncharacterized membrane protein